MSLDDLIRQALQLRKEGRFDDALAKIDEAIRRDPLSPTAHRYRGQTLSYQAAKGGCADKSVALDRALGSIDRAVQLQGGESPDTLHDKAWIADERGDYATAIGLYREARERARREGRVETRNVDAFSYNLACALSKSGDGESALAELRELPSDLLAIAATDGDFANLRVGEHASRFEALVGPIEAGTVRSSGS